MCEKKEHIWGVIVLNLVAKQVLIYRVEKGGWGVFELFAKRFTYTTFTGS